MITRVVLALAVVLAAGCSGSSEPAAHGPSPSPTPSTSATTPSGAQLQHLAGVAKGTSYAATYRAHQRKPATTRTWRVWRTTSAIRVDVVTRHTVTTIIVNAHGAFSCRKAPHRRACFQVAKPGRPIPAPFDLAPQTVFSTDVVQLASSVDGYDVTSAADRPASGDVPAAHCFAVKPTSAAPKPRVDAGTYCLADTGLITAVTYPSGNTIVLTSAALRTPPRARFTPYAKATPLPG